MEIGQSIQKYTIIALIGVIAVLLLFGFIKNRSHQSALVDLRNQIASRDQTIEVQKGLYTKLSVQTDDVKSLLDSKQTEVAELLSELKGKDQTLLAANQLAVKWKKAYEASVSGTQTTVPGTNGTERKKVEFAKDFGLINVKGWTLTDPPEAWVSIDQSKPLVLTVAISQDKDGFWHSYASSSDPNTSVQLNLSAVNPYILEPKWYEKIRVNSSVAVGSGPDGVGALVGLGVAYEFGHFDLGPSLFFSVTDKVDRFVGASFGWRPFQRN